MMVRAVIACCLLLIPVVAQAHMLPKQNATMKIVDDTANFVVSVPVSALADVDDDNDGQLSAQEIRKHEKMIERQFSAASPSPMAASPEPVLCCW